MDIDLDRITERIKQNNFINDFMEELNKALEKFSPKNEFRGDKMDEVKLTQQEELEFDKRRGDFLENFFKEELSDLSKGEIYIVTDKYEEDYEYHRYKVTQYINNIERKRIALEKDLPENVQIGDIVRKIDGKYIYDEEATQYIKENIDRIKQEVLEARN